MSNIDKVKELTEKLEEGVKSVFDSSKFKDYLKTMSKFHRYSFGNTLFIYMQRPDATRVAGYQTWQKDFNRHVKRGETGIKILAPVPYKSEIEKEKIDPVTKKPILNEDGQKETELVEVCKKAFKTVTVFDVSQTDGEPLPNLIEELSEEVKDYDRLFETLSQVSPMPISLETIQSNAKGFCNYEERRIVIKEGMSQAQTLKTAIHEITHAWLHDPRSNNETDFFNEQRKDRYTREVEAESVAYVICQHYGIDSSDYSFGYVASWSRDKELSDLKRSLETIRSTASEIIDKIDEQYRTLEATEKSVEEYLKNEEGQSGGLRKEIARKISFSDQLISNEQGDEKVKQGNNSKYYPIDEDAARRAKEANSHFSHSRGSATVEYKAMVDKAYALGEKQKQQVDLMHHEKINHLVDQYARKLADNINERNIIDARVPSMLISGRGNFPIRAKEKQNAARDKNMEEMKHIQGLLEKIKSIGRGGISADDPNAIHKLKSKLSDLESAQETMKAVNAYYRKHQTLDGCPHMSTEHLERVKESMARSSYSQPKPFETWALSNNNAEIKRIKERIKKLTHREEKEYQNWDFDGGKVVANKEVNRLQIFFDQKPNEEMRSTLKSNGFRWAPSSGAWQRQLTDNAMYAVKRIPGFQALPKETQSDYTQNNDEWEMEF